MAGLDLWESAIIHTLLYNCSTWMEINKEAEDKLEDLQLYYLRLLLAVPVSCPKVALRLHTGTLSMKYRVLIEKVMLVYHMIRLPTSTLSNRVYKEQLENNWPGLAREVKDICAILQVESVHVTEIKKEKYKKLISQACYEMDEREMK